MRRLSIAGLALVVFLSGAALGAITLFFVADPSNPPSLPDASTATQVPTASQRYVDDQAVDLVFRRVADATIRAPRDGVLTATACEAGGTLASGGTSFAVDGAPLLSLHTAVPLFRDLRVGDRGPDVAAVAAELERLGYGASAGDTFTALDLAAVRALLDAIGGSAPEASLVAADIVWLPDIAVTISACDAELGQRVDAGAAVAKAGRAPQVTIDAQSEDLLPGPRELSVDGLVIPVTPMPATGQLGVESSADVAALTNTPTYARAAGEAGPGDVVVIAATASLIQPLSVVPLPPTAIALAPGDGAASSRGCVTDGQVSFEVQIVGSTAGSTLVYFSDQQPPDAVSLTAPTQCP